MKNFLLNLFENLRFNIYIRDVSFLGFNSYQIIVPGMSEIHIKTKRNWKDFITPFDVISYVRNINNLSNLEIYELSEDLENFIASYSSRSWVTFKEYFALPISFFLPWEIVTSQLLQSIFNYRLGNYEKSYYFMKEYCEFSENLRENIINKEMLYAIQNFLALSINNSKDFKKISQILQQIYEKSIIDKIFTIFSGNSKILSIIKTIIPNFELPNCWDCKNCLISSYCFYMDLEELHLNIKKKNKEFPIDQESVQRILES